MGWDGINYWYWCLHRSKVCSKAHRLPSMAFRQFGQQGYAITYVCTDEFTQTGATYYITIFRFQEGVARVHRRRKLLESAEEGEVAHSQSSKNLVSKKQGRAPRSQNKSQAIWNGITCWCTGESLSYIHPSRTWCVGKSRMPQVLHSQWVPE